MSLIRILPLVLALAVTGCASQAHVHTTPAPSLYKLCTDPGTRMQCAPDAPPLIDTNLAAPAADKTVALG